jgi:integrase
MRAFEAALQRGDQAAIAEAKQRLEAARTRPLARPHDCRHAFASHMLAVGLTAHAVAQLLGHADAALVTRRYGHALPDELARAGEMLSAWRLARGL